MENIFLEENIGFYRSVKSTLEKIPSRALFVVDRNVYENWSELSLWLQDKKVYLLEASELYKTLEEVERIYDFLYKNQTVEPLVAIGGGITGDVAGFAAATFKRGIPLILIPTTLLSMCDSTVGGKCGVNYKGVKNYIGTFKKPDDIFITTEFLETLPIKDLKSGMGEVLKYGVIGHESILDLLESEDTLESVDTRKYIELGLKIKLEVVAEDFHDRGIRNILNFGHNIAHALEAAYPEMLTHGEAVALGLLVELKLSEDLLSLDPGIRRRVRGLMTKFCMTTGIPGLSKEKILGFIKKDKKNDENLRFTLLSAPGCARIKQSVAEEKIESALKEIME